MNESLISTVLGALVVIVVGVLIYNYFSGVNKIATEDQMAQEGVTLIEENGQLVPQGLPKTHVVAKGEHLWSIALKYYDSGYNWVNIAQENQIVNPSQITEGMELVIPKTAQIAIESKKPAVADEAMMVNNESNIVNQHVVVAGDTLWNIAVRAYGDGYAWTSIYEANVNQVSNANVIEKGMVLKIPVR